MTTDPHLQAEADHSGRTGPLRVLAQGPRRRSAMRTLTVSGRNLRVAVRRGNPKWPPLLLCNGIGARLEMLEPLVSALEPEREVVRFDMTGIGGSPAPVIPYHMTTLAPLVTGLLDQLGYQRADVLGISWGGGLAQHLAVQSPGRVRRLVLDHPPAAAADPPARADHGGRRRPHHPGDQRADHAPADPAQRADHLRRRPS